MHRPQTWYITHKSYHTYYYLDFTFTLKNERVSKDFILCTFTCYRTFTLLSISNVLTMLRVHNILSLSYCPSITLLFKNLLKQYMQTCYVYCMKCSCFRSHHHTSSIFIKLVLNNPLFHLFSSWCSAPDICRLTHGVYIALAL